MKNNASICWLLAGLLIAGCATNSPAHNFKKTFSSFDLPTEHAGSVVPSAATMDFKGVDLSQFLEIYAAVSKRTVLRGALPDVKFVLRPASPLNAIEQLQTFDTLLAQNGIVMIYAGERTVKAVPVDRLKTEVLPEIDQPWSALPESSSPMLRKVYLKKYRPSQVLPVLQPLASLPNSIVAVDAERLLILRDYSANIRQQLKLIEELEQKKTP
jgi:type II secretory pathway component GspD/PulD (secretin)